MESDVGRSARELYRESYADEERNRKQQRRGGEKGVVLAVAVGALVLIAVLGKVGAIPGGSVYAVILALYFLPAMIASNRGHRNSGPIFVVNLFLGWTLIGWVGCLAWGLAHQEAVR